MAEQHLLTEQINALTADQAQRALLLLYELMPREWWEEQEKPQTEDIRDWVALLQEQASTDVQPLLSTLNSSGNESLKGELARTLLREFSQYDNFRPYVQTAVQRAMEPHMAPIPVFIGAYLILMALLPNVVDIKKGDIHIHLEFNNLQYLAQLADDLKQFLKQLVPPDLWG